MSYCFPLVTLNEHLMEGCTCLSIYWVLYKWVFAQLIWCIIIIYYCYWAPENPQQPSDLTWMKGSCLQVVHINEMYYCTITISETPDAHCMQCVYTCWFSKSAMMVLYCNNDDFSSSVPTTSRLCSWMAFSLRKPLMCQDSSFQPQGVIPCWYYHPCLVDSTACQLSGIYTLGHHDCSNYSWQCILSHLNFSSGSNQEMTVTHSVQCHSQIPGL